MVISVVVRQAPRGDPRYGRLGHWGRPAVRLVVAKLIFGTGVILLPLMPSVPGLMLVAAFAAINGPFENLALLHLYQSRFPAQRLGQVYRVQMCSVFAGLLAAYLVAPTLFDRFGLAPMIMAAGAMTFAMGLLGFALFLRPRRLPETAPAGD